ncbi:hypothetical protein [Nonomuraea sp. NPDC049709]|uniref:hypothetical protein n=1 Tax=Nonomuraea sp. NPDC049709 TaxID=3154736 RepID=UPI0034469A17
MSQILNYGDPYMEMLSIFLRLLEKVIAESSWSADVDLSDVVLVGVKHNKAIAVDISMTGDGQLKGISAAGTGTKKEPNLRAVDQEVWAPSLSPGDEYEVPLLGPLHVDNRHSERLIRFLTEITTRLTERELGSKLHDRIRRSALRFLSTSYIVAYRADVTFSDDEPAGGAQLHDVAREPAFWRR